MKSEQLLDALNDIDDSLIAETNPFQEEEITKPALRVTGGTGQGGKRKMRKSILLVAVCAVLLLSGVVAYAATGGDLLNIIRNKGTNGEGGETTVEYLPVEQTVVPMSALRGEIQNAPAEIQRQIDEFNALPEMDRMASSTMPDVLRKGFDTVDDAIEYIGYDQLHYPKINYPEENVSVDMLGCETQDGYSLSMFTLDVTQRYSSNPVYFCQSITTFFTEHADASYAMRLALSEKAELATEQRVVNGRTFSILHTNDPDPDNENGKMLGTEVFTTDNNVIFMFHITYDDNNRADAEAVIGEWMNSFSGK